MATQKSSGAHTAPLLQFFILFYSHSKRSTFFARRRYYLLMASCVILLFHPLGAFAAQPGKLNFMLFSKESVLLQPAVKILHIRQHCVRDPAAASAVQMVMWLCPKVISHILAHQLDPGDAAFIRRIREDPEHSRA